MLTIAKISSVIPFLHPDKTKQAIVQEEASPPDLIDIEYFERARNSDEPESNRPARVGGIVARLAWMAPVAIFGCLAFLVVFAWIVSWLDRR